MKKGSWRSLCWLLLIPAQLIAGAFFVRLGSLIDLALLTSSDGGGHGIPFFSTIFFLMAAVMTLAVSILALALTIRSFRHARR